MGAHVRRVGDVATGRDARVVMALRQVTRSPSQRASADRDEAREEREEQRRADRYAASFGPCAVCKVDVGADGIHAWNCTTVSTERRASRGRRP